MIKKKINMRKINKIVYIICFVVGLSLFISGCSYKSGVEAKLWFQYALEYDQAMSKMWASGGLVLYSNKMRKIEQKFLHAKQPTETEIISVLRSPNRRFQKIGLAAMSLKPIETDSLTDILFEFLRDQEPGFRWYAMLSLDKFTKFPESRKADLGKQLLEIIKNEKDDALPLFQQFNLLVRYPSEGTAQFLTELVMKEGKEKRKCIVKYRAFMALKEMGDSFYDEAVEYVNKYGSSEIKKELLEWSEQGERQGDGRDTMDDGVLGGGGGSDESEGVE